MSRSFWTLVFDSFPFWNLRRAFIYAFKSLAVSLFAGNRKFFLSIIYLKVLHKQKLTEEWLPKILFDSESNGRKQFKLFRNSNLSRLKSKNLFRFKILLSQRASQKLILLVQRDGKEEEEIMKTHTHETKNLKRNLIRHARKSAKRLLSPALKSTFWY